MKFYSILLYFNNLYFGNCVTFAFYNPNKQFIVSYSFETVRTNLEPPIIVIHEKDTSPVFNAENVFYIDAFLFFVKLFAKKSIYELNSWFADSACVNGDTTSLQSWNFKNAYNVTTNQYKYSYKSCLDQCVHELTKKYCNCILPKSMIRSNEEQLPLCSTICNLIPKDKLDNMCNCRTTYHHIEFALAKQKYRGDNEEYILLNYIQLWKMIETKPLTVDNLFITRKESHLYWGGVQIYILKSSVISISFVQPTVKLVDALSTVGGVWGLWIGLSVSIIFSLGVETLRHFKKAKASLNHTNKPKATLLNGKHFCMLFHDMLWWTGVVAILFKVIEVVTTELQDNTSFPTVYACSNTFIYNTSENMQNKTDLAKKIEYMHILNANNLRRENVDLYRLNLTDVERLLLLPAVSDFIESCKFYSESGEYIPCRLQEKRLFGFFMRIVSSAKVCAIILPNIPEMRNTLVQNLIIDLKYPKNYATFNMISTKIGFDPFSMLDDERSNIPLATVEVTPGSHVTFKYSMTETRRLPHPYTSNCIPSNTTYDVWPDIFKDFSGNTSYSYNYKTCLHLCLLSPKFNYTCDEGSIDPAKCRYDISGCGCHYPCNSNEYSFKISQAENAYKQRIEYGHYDSISELKDYMWSGKSVVEIEKGSPYKTVKAEKPAVQPDSLVGLIGGISGLWIGQSILNLFVEFQALITAIYTKLNSPRMKI